MLGKLLKHEFRSTGKVLVPVHLALIVITIIGSILLGTKILQRDEMIFMSMGLLLMYILLLVALAFVTTIFLMVHYYRSMFSAQGYLTFTLPTSTWTIFNSKVIVGFAWMLINTAITFISILSLIGAAGGFQDIAKLVETVFVSEMSFGDETISMTVMEMIGYTPLQFSLLCVAALLLASFYTVAMSYGSITIGQLYAKHKVVGAVLAYAAIYIFVQIVMTVSMFAFSFTRMFKMILTTPETELTGTALVDMMQSIYQPIVPIALSIYCCWGTVLCGIGNYY